MLVARTSGKLIRFAPVPKCTGTATEIPPKAAFAPLHAAEHERFGDAPLTGDPL